MGGVWTLKARADGTGGLQRCWLPLQGRDLCGESLMSIQAGQHCGGQQNGFLKRSAAKGCSEIISVHYLMRSVTSKIGTEQRCLVPFLPLSLTPVMGPGMDPCSPVT